jgi:hypothetical protein
MLRHMVKPNSDAKLPGLMLVEENGQRRRTKHLRARVRANLLHPVKVTSKGATSSQKEQEVRKGVDG